ncbi:MAG: hypothetical protein A2104_09175 [Candidatus Melainabacteria bacterium GWF2_32_7]|nr:MAG: hypothetical protein A2104_09175 [Candidatus Melainabacteria bacterium GWF2_32_7]
MNNKKINKKSPSKDNLQNKNNLKPLIFTFLGTFIVFFFAFTVLLPILTPQVDIPAFTDEHSTDSVDSNDFKGRIDPRLSSIEQEENAAPPKLKMEIPVKNQQSQDGQTITDDQNTDGYSTTDPQEPQDVIPGEENNSGYNTSDNHTQPQKTTNKAVKPLTVANIPPRPKTSQQYTGETEKPITMSKVVLGSYATPMQARLISDTLIEMDLNVAPFIKEKNGRYVLQVGSFSDPAKADGLVQELQNKGFNAKTINE